MTSRTDWSPPAADASTVSELKGLLQSATSECLARLPPMAGPGGKIPSEGISYDRVVPVQNASDHHEGRPDAIATDGTRSILRVTVQVADAVSILRPNWKEISRWPEVENLLRHVEALESQGHRDAFTAAKVTPIPVCENYVLVLLAQAIRWRSLAGSSDSWSDSAANRLARALSLSGEMHQYVAPLIGFDASPPEPLDVTPTQRIRPVNEEEREELSTRQSILGFPHHDLPGHLRFIPIDWVAECDTFEPVPGHVADPATPFNTILKLVRALRVFQDGRVDFSIVGNRYLPFGSIGSGTPNPWFPLSVAWTTFDPTYVLAPDRREPALTFFRKFVLQPSGNATAWVDLAATRLDDAHRRALDRDQLIDSVVLLEAVLLHDGEDELSYRMASRGAHLLGSTPEERGYLYRTLKKAYARRSKIVHGKSDDGDPSGRTILPIARRILFTAIECTEDLSLDDLLHALDLFPIARRDDESLTKFLARLESESGRSQNREVEP